MVLTVFSSCQAEVTRGEKFILKDNTDNENWVVQANNGVTKSLPGVCFNIPPPDPEAIDKLDRYHTAVCVGCSHAHEHKRCLLHFL